MVPSTRQAPVGMPSTPTGTRPAGGGGILDALEQTSAVATAVAIAATLVVLTPLGNQPVLRVFRPLAQALWLKAWAVAVGAWALGIVPRQMSGRATQMDMLAMGVLKAAGALGIRVVRAFGGALWRLLQNIPAVKAVVERLAGWYRAVAAKLGMAAQKPAPQPRPESFFPDGPPLELLPIPSDQERRKQSYAAMVQRALTEHGVAGAVVIGEVSGPTVASVHVALPPGVRASTLRALEPDLAVTLGVQSATIRPVVGKPGTVAVEVPFKRRRTVYLREVVETQEFAEMAERGALPLAMGIDTSATPIAYDLAKAPHMLVAGATGTGKSVFLNAVLVSLLYTRTPAQLRLVLVDPKQVEFGRYAGLPHLVLPPISEMEAVPGVLDWLIREMEARYAEMKRVGAERIKRYNAMARQLGLSPFPYVVLVVDELADLMLQNKGRKKKARGEDDDTQDVEDQILRLVQKARAAGIHLILGTQRPSTDVITGTIKANVDARVAFRVSSQVDSRVILDQPGAETLVGSGDMLFRAPGADLVRIQGPLLGEDAVERIVKWWQEHWKGKAGRLLVPPPGGSGSDVETPLPAGAGQGAAPEQPEDLLWLGANDSPPGQNT